MPCGAGDGNHPLVQQGEVTPGPQLVILGQWCLEILEPLKEPNDCNNIDPNISHEKLIDSESKIKQKYDSFEEEAELPACFARGTT